MLAVVSVGYAALATCSRWARPHEWRKVRLAGVPLHIGYYSVCLMKKLHGMSDLCPVQTMQGVGVVQEYLQMCFLSTVMYFWYRLKDTSVATALAGAAVGCRPVGHSYGGRLVSPPRGMRASAAMLERSCVLLRH